MQGHHYIQALGIAKNLLATPICFAITRNTARPHRLCHSESTQALRMVWPIAKYLGCSKALWKVGSEAYADQIRVYLKHPDSQVRWWAEHALADDHN